MVTKKFAMLAGLVLLVILVLGCSRKEDPTSSPAAATTSAIESSKSGDVQSLTFHSTALDRDMKVNLYLPNGYDPKQAYPVLYLFHGYGGNEGSWVPGLKVNEAADELIEQGSIHPLIIVSPEMDNSYGINSADSYAILNPNDPGESIYVGRYEDYIIQDLIPYIDTHYSTITTKEGRYSGGLSMGGFIGIHTAFAHPDLFSKAGGHSPALLLNDGILPGLYDWIYPDEQTRKLRVPFELAQIEDLSGLQVYLDCGKSDGYRFYDGSEKMAELLKKKGVRYEYHLNEGGHDGAYWLSHVRDYLRFYAGV